MEKRRQFELSGFSRKEKLELIKLISSLGGNVNTDQAFSTASTHVLMKSLSRSEKFLCGLSSGLWIVKESYITDCVKAGEWLSEEEYVWKRDENFQFLPVEQQELTSAVEQSMARREKHLLFNNWVAAVILLSNVGRKPVYERILSVGGARIVQVKLPVTSTRNIPEGITHLFTEDEYKNQISPITRQGVHCLRPVFIGHHLVHGIEPLDEHYVVPFCPRVKQETLPIVKPEVLSSDSSAGSDVIFISENKRSGKSPSDSDVEFVCEKKLAQKSVKQEETIVDLTSESQGEGNKAFTPDSPSQNGEQKTSSSSNTTTVTVDGAADADDGTPDSLKRLSSDGDLSGESSKRVKVESKHIEASASSACTSSEVSNTQSSEQGMREILSEIENCADLCEGLKQLSMEDRERIYLKYNSSVEEEVPVVDCSDDTGEAVNPLGVLITKQIETHLEDENADVCCAGVEMLQNCVSYQFRPAWTSIRYVLNILTCKETDVFLATRCYECLSHILYVHAPSIRTIDKDHREIRMKQIYLRAIGKSTEDFNMNYLHYLTTAVSVLVDAQKVAGLHNGVIEDEDISELPDGVGITGCRLFIHFLADLIEADADLNYDSKEMLVLICESRHGPFPKLYMDRGGCKVLIKSFKLLMQNKEVSCAESVERIICRLAQVCRGKGDKSDGSPSNLAIQILVTALAETLEDVEIMTYQSLLSILPPWLAFMVCTYNLDQHNTQVASQDCIKSQELSLCALICKYFYMVPKWSGGDINGEVEKSNFCTKKKPSLLTKRNIKGETPLHIACIKNQLDRVKALLHSPDVDVNLPDYCGWTPIHEACNYGHSVIVETMLKMRNTLPTPGGVNLMATSQEGITPIHDAVQNNHAVVVKILLKYGGVKLLSAKSSTGKTPLDLARSEEMKVLLQSYKESSAANLSDHLVHLVNRPSLAPDKSSYDKLPDIEYNEEVCTRYALDVMNIISLYIATRTLNQEDRAILHRLGVHLQSFQNHMTWLCKGEHIPVIVQERIQTLLLNMP